MENRYEFFIAGSWGYGNKNQTPEEKQKEFENFI